MTAEGYWSRSNHPADGVDGQALLNDARHRKQLARLKFGALLRFRQIRR